MRLLLTIGVAYLLSGPAPVTSVARQDQTPAYPTLVAAYRQWRLGAADMLLKLPERDVSAAVEQAIRPAAGQTPWAWEDLRAAALLHTDAWYTDLSHKRAGDANVQLEHAKALLARAVRLEPTLADYAQRWCNLVALLLSEHGTEMQLEDFRNRRRLLFPLTPSREKAIPFVRRGITAEYAGSTKGLVMAPSPSGPMGGVAFQMRWWADAATQFSQALALDSTYHLAALHLGRVRMLQGNRTEAVEQFNHAAGAHDARVAYLAWLFLGGLAERDGRYDEAEKFYRSARDRYPSGQAAPLALSQLLSRTSRESDARDVLTAFLTNRRGRVVEPLWTYIPSPVVELDDMLASLAELRAEVMK
jgi:tetratricopeptide (TPR) repeat protein